MRTPRRGGSFAGLMAMLVLLGIVSTACGDNGPYIPAGIIRTPAPQVGGVVLPDATNGGDFHFVAQPGGILIVYFGYTSCPDVCPTTMADVRKARRNLGDDASKIDVAMVTVDPDRDTAEVLTAYVHAFVPDGTAVRSEDPEALAAAARPFGAQYSVTVLEDGWIDVVHSAFLYAIDDQGTLRLTWPFGTESEYIENDLRALLEGELDDA